jgi:thiamine-monophosphate kinase
MTGRTQLAADALEAVRARLETPVPRIALGQALRGVASAALDVSDGLVGDLSHILERSAVGAVLDLPAIPRSRFVARLFGGAERALAVECLLAGGDDYELCFTAPPAAAPPIARIAADTAVPLTRIGSITRAKVVSRMRRKISGQIRHK